MKKITAKSPSTDKSRRLEQLQSDGTTHGSLTRLWQ
jgi:hypothetical protein